MKKTLAIFLVVSASAIGYLLANYNDINPDAINVIELEKYTHDKEKISDTVYVAYPLPSVDKKDPVITQEKGDWVWKRKEVWQEGESPFKEWRQANASEIPWYEQDVATRNAIDAEQDKWDKITKARHKKEDAAKRFQYYNHTREEIIVLKMLATQLHNEGKMSDAKYTKIVLKLVVALNNLP